MQRFHSFINQILEINFKFKPYILGFFSLIVLSVVSFTLDKGFIFSDEAWHLMHLKEGAQQVSSSLWADYLMGWQPKNLFIVRICTTCILLISSFVLGLGIRSYFKIGSIAECIFISTLGYFLLRPSVQLIPCYYTFSQIIFYLGSGFYLFSLSSHSKRLSILFGILTGIIISQMTFIVITTISVYSILITLPFLVNKDNKQNIRIITAIVVGTLIGISLFFLFITPFHDFINQIKLSTDFLKYDPKHGLFFIIQWTYGTFVFFIQMIFVPSALVYLIIINKNIRNSYLKYLLLFILIAYFYYDVNFDITRNKTNFTTPNILLILSTAILFKYLEDKNYKEFYISFFLMSLLFFGNIGTDVYFPLKSTFFMVPIFFIMYNYALKSKDTTLYGLFTIAITIYIVLFSSTYLIKPGWQLYTIKDQDISLNSIGINNNIKLDKTTIDKIQEVKQYLNKDKTVIISNDKLWGYIYLLNLKTPLLYFYYNESLLSNYLTQHPINDSELFLLELKKFPFPDEMHIKKDYSIKDTIFFISDPDLRLYRYIKK